MATILNNLTDNSVIVNLPGGELKINWSQSFNNTDSDLENVYMTGKSEFVFDGKYWLE